MVLRSRRAATVSNAGSSFTFWSATWMTASSSCCVVIPSKRVISSSDAICVTQPMFSSRPCVASSMARLILFASYGSFEPSLLTTVIDTLHLLLGNSHAERRDWWHDVWLIEP